MLGIYLSGTGNTKHCTEKLLHLLDETAKAVPIEKVDTANELPKHGFIVLSYPVQFSNVPIMVRDFIRQHSALWQGKKVLCVATMGLFSGDGAGCSARLLKRRGAKVVGGLHIKMPDSVCDVKLLKKSMEKNREIIKAADRKIERWAERIRRGKYPKDGLYFFDRVAGLICQRLWCYGKTRDYSDGLKISDNCTGCGKCVGLCPMGNLALEGGKSTAKGRCTMCYRCISSCPQRAITLLGDAVVEQCRYERYVK